MRRILTSVVLLLTTILVQGQTVPKENLITSKTSLTTLSHGNAYDSFKASSLYYNDSVAVITVNGFKGSPFAIKIYERNYSKLDRTLWLSSYTNSQINNYPDTAELHQRAPATRIEIEDAESNGKPYKDVTIYFNTGEIRLSFGLDANSHPELIPAFKKKYARFLGPTHRPRSEHRLSQ